MKKRDEAAVSMASMQPVRTPTPALDLAGVEVRVPGDLDAALALLADHGPDAAPLAGATWTMRAAQLGRAMAPVQVALAGIAQLREIVVEADAVRLGAMATHQRLAGVQAAPAYAVVARAAGTSAFPAVRRMATVGGNVATIAFHEADLVPALLVAEATVELATPGASGDLRSTMDLRSPNASPVGEYLAQRGGPGLVTAVTVPLRAGRDSSYERLTVRRSGEYAVASIALSIDRAPDGTVTAARVSAGSVEATARLLPGAASALLGAPLHDESISRAGAAAQDEVSPREGLDAPAWYRAAVLPALLRRAAQRILDAETGR